MSTAGARLAARSQGRKDWAVPLGTMEPFSTGDSSCAPRASSGHLPAFLCQTRGVRTSVSGRWLVASPANGQMASFPHPSLPGKEPAHPRQQPGQGGPLSLWLPHSRAPETPREKQLLLAPPPAPPSSALVPAAPGVQPSPFRVSLIPSPLASLASLKRQADSQRARGGSRRGEGRGVGWAEECCVAVFPPRPLS